MASRAEMWPDARAIESCLNGLAKAPFGDDVLVEAELSAGHEDSVQLGERYLLVDHRAKDERADSGIKDAVPLGQQFGCAIDDFDRHGRGASGIAGKPTEKWLRLNREDLRHIGWVVGEVAAIARPHLENPSTQTREQLRALLVRSHFPRNMRPNPREHGMLGGACR